MTLLGILGGHNLCNLFPVLVIELFDKLGILDHEGKQSILEQMCLIILPLSKSSLTLCGIFLLVEELVEYFHGLFVRYDALAVELVLSVSEPDDVVDACASLAAGAGVALPAD